MIAEARGLLKPFKILEANEFVQMVLEDSRKVLSEINTADLPDEYQYYVQKVGFYLGHTLTWCKQLDLALELLFNYDYSSKTESSRADHLIFNIENYLIRLNSVYDRILQITNAVFHIGVDEELVGHAIIISNAQVRHRPAITRKIKAIKKCLDKYAKERHTLVHKHSYLDAELRKIEMLYLPHMEGLVENIEGWKGHIKTFRAKYLRDYLAERKTEFSLLNGRLALLINDFFKSLLSEYVRQKSRLM